MKTLHISDIIQMTAADCRNLDIHIDLFNDRIDYDDVRFTFDGCNNNKNDLVYHMNMDRVSTNYDTLMEEGWFDDDFTLEQYALTEIAYFVIGQLTGESFYDQDCYDWWLGTPTKI